MAQTMHRRWSALVGSHASSPATLAEPAPRCELEPLEKRLLLSVSLEAGWTQVTPSSDTRTVYVSSSEGDDTGSGLSAATPVATIAKAVSLVRDNSADWILLKRGDVWYEGLGNWTRSGRSEQEPILISSYGDSKVRPILKTGADKAISTSSNRTVSNVIISGLHFYAHTRDPLSAEFVSDAGTNGVTWFASGSNLLLEDMLIQSYKINVMVQATNGFSNFQVRRSGIIDAYAINGSSHGLFTYNVDGILLETNTFDHNGWNEHLADARRTIYNHNVYIQANCTGLIARYNIFARASSHGLQARSGGVIGNNTFLRNAIGLSVGLVRGGAVANGLVPANGVSASVRYNVIINSDDISATAPRGYGMELGNLRWGVIEHNILTSESSAGKGSIAILIEGDFMWGMRNVSINNNTIYDWQGGIRVRGSAANFRNVRFTGNAIQNHDTVKSLIYIDEFVSGGGFSFSDNTYHSPRSRWFQLGSKTYTFSQWQGITGEVGSSAQLLTYTDPSRSVESYALTRGVRFLEYFLYFAASNSKPQWRAIYTAPLINDYIRQGFAIL